MLVKIVLRNNVFAGTDGAPGWFIEKTFEVPLVDPRIGDAIDGAGIADLVVAAIRHDIRDGRKTVVVEQQKDGAWTFVDNSVLEGMLRDDPEWKRRTYQ